jgi:ribose 5-phosphate isomerase A
MAAQDEFKRRAAEASMAFLPSGGIVGLGSGTTALWAIRLIGERISTHPGERGLAGVATSLAAARAAIEAGIPLLDEESAWELAVAFDGADEVSPELELIKGGGGALLREKIVNAASTFNVILVDESKLSGALGERCRLPVEVARFGWRQTCRAVQALAGEAVRRERDGAPFVTDNGNYILDVRTGPIGDPGALEQALETLPGVVVSGLFVGRVDALVVAGAGGVEIRRRP